jgi:hypothetical protein
MAKNAIEPEVARAFIAETNAKIDALSAKLDSGAIDKSTIKAVTIPAAKGGEGGKLYEVGPRADEEPEPELALGHPEPVKEPPTVNVAGDAPPPLTDAQIYDKCALFLDPTALGPVFMSSPIRGKVYIGKYPNFAEMLSASRVMGGTESANEETLRVYEVAGELSTAIRGWLPAHDQRIETIKANITDASKWPPLYHFSIFDQRDPRIMQDVLDIWVEYLAWKSRVVPTEDELEKYEGRLTKRSS